MRCGGLDGGDFCFAVLHLLREIGRLLFLQVGHLFLQSRHVRTRLGHGAPEVVLHRRQLGELHGGKHPGERIIILRGDRVGFVIMAARAGQREAEEGTADGIHVLLPFIGHGGLDDLGRELQLFEVGRAQADEAQRHAILRSALGQEIRGKLAHDEAVVGHVFVQRLHHPVAVEVGVFGGVQPVGGLVRVARQIQPVACPALAVVRTAQGFIDQAAPVCRPLLCGRQAGEIKGQPALQHALFRPRGRFQACGLHFGEDEVVDAGFRPCGVLDLGQGAATERCEGPRHRFRPLVLFGDCNTCRCEEQQSQTEGAGSGKTHLPTTALRAGSFHSACHLSPPPCEKFHKSRLPSLFGLGYWKPWPPPSSIFPAKNPTRAKSA